MNKKMALGRGLGALIDDAPAPASSKAEQQPQQPIEKKVVSDLVNEIDIESIDVNPFQPRSNFDQDALNELAESIKKLGIIQPITVRNMDNGRFQLISGERRLRASKIAGLKRIPAYVRKTDDQGMLEMALVENIQREDLDAIEVAISYQRLIDECNLTQETLGDRVGKKRATVSNYLRLLRLPAEIQAGIRERLLSMGHARTLITIDDPINQVKIYRRILEEELSVRKTEELVRQIQEGAPVNASTDKGDDNAEQNGEDVGFASLLKEDLTKVFGWGVDVKQTPKGNGKIVISYRTEGELLEIIEKFNRLKE
ncbi:MAG TPA: ParB/RepB/Spo0J family partition protein [Tenuifilaceae bacterium]|jgi:ParB family chromosome partitioning protein|nr:ParB/RepB/Spo0J family partition protein [Tenuifilaceae bacterium]HPX05999.1 ParB/RepB/Spo0J family partition protein [Tenuifilaceae bacterium]HQB77722.1 ParB/RepB/Spo0J family partition protein [Tenuifilaceae bacterium]